MSNAVQEVAKAKRVIQECRDTGRHRGMADRGRRNIYRAENKVYGGNIWTAEGQIARDEVEEAVEMVAEWARVNILGIDPSWCYKPKVVFSGKSSGGAASYYSYRSSSCYLQFPQDRTHYSMAIILHEVAHWATPDDVGHGDAWKAVYVALVREFMGSAYSARLESALESAPKRRTFRCFVRYEGDEHWTLTKVGSLKEGSSVSDAQLQYARAVPGAVQRAYTLGKNYRLIQFRMEEK